jgi:hypothetical protein
MRRPLLPVPVVFACLPLVSARAADRLEFRQGDRICIRGNSLADRRQRSGWLEALIHPRVPRHELVFRKVSLSGDELTAPAKPGDYD